jgi:hypothetical protein
MKLLSSAIERLFSRSYTAHFGVVGDSLRAFDSGKMFGAYEVIICEYRQFEGVAGPPTTGRSCRASESLDGPRGSLVDAFGTCRFDGPSPPVLAVRG